MKHLTDIDVMMHSIEGTVHVVEWEHGDNFPELADTVGIDTETELFTAEKHDPPVVVVGLYNPKDMTCYVVYWYDVAEFMQYVCSTAAHQVYFNLGYDEAVIDNEDQQFSLMIAIDEDKVVDMQIRVHLHMIATLGYIPGLYSLADCSKFFLGVTLDKGDPDHLEDSARMTFSRSKRITDEQAKYLPYDCMTTYAISQKVPAMESEITHTKGMVALAHISNNGFLQDPKVAESFRQDLYRSRDDARNRLVMYGFPDPYKDMDKERSDIIAMLKSSLEWFTSITDLTTEQVTTKLTLRWLLMFLWDHDQCQDEIPLLKSDFTLYLKKPITMKKEQKKFYESMLDQLDQLENIDTAPKKICYAAFMAYVLTNVIEQIKATGTYKLEDAMVEANEYLDRFPEWFTKQKPIGPKKFFDDHVKRLLEQHPELNLTKTDGGTWKLTKQDMWRLEDCNITDSFLDAYTTFYHAQKYLSTYLKPEDVKKDGKVHPTFTNIVRTGRTSAVRPNTQNYPSHDPVYPLKNIYRPPEGMILCATDYSFLELVCFAESCYTRFGMSVMRDIINAGVDPHRWFAGVKAGIIDASTDFCRDPKEVEAVMGLLKEKVSKDARSHAKAANFG